MYPLIAVTLPPVDDPTARDTIALIAGVHAADMPDVLRYAAECYVRRALNLDADTDTPRAMWSAVHARLGWHVAESGCVASGVLVSVAADAVARAIADLEPVARMEVAA